jgi:hypothetical protein
LTTTPSVRIAPVPAAQPATSTLSLTVARMERVVDLIEARLKRLEHSHSSLRRRVVNQRVASS